MKSLVMTINALSAVLNIGYYEFNYCDCGQKLKWGEDDDE